MLIMLLHIYIYICLISVSTGLSVVTMCIDLASTHLKAYFTRFHYFGRAKKFLGMREELKEIVVLLRAMRRKKGGKVCVKFSFIKFYTVKSNWNFELSYIKIFPFSYPSGHLE